LSRRGSDLSGSFLEIAAVTKKEIVKQISEEIQLTQLKTKEIVQKTLNAIIQTLVAEGRIELRNFGVFEVVERAPRKARNPRTGARVSVPAKNVVTFKPGKEMEELVRQMKSEKVRKEEASDDDMESNGSVEVLPTSARDHRPATVDSSD
jgi:integration host factor subunit beta